jgi:DNA-3-methyladenine glycosylase II
MWAMEMTVKMREDAANAGGAEVRRFTIQPQGEFSLRELALFGFGQRESEAWDGVMRLAFCLDGYRQQVGVEVRQDAEGVHCAVHGGGRLDAVRRQVARVLSLDFDGRLLDAIGERDPVVARLLHAAPGLRPPLFYSPYEAAVWVVMSARRPRRQVAEVRRQLSEAHGRVFELAGLPLAALPTPEQLLSVESVPGLNAEKVRRMHVVARAAIDGRLDVRHLHELGPDAALAELQSLPGVGPFYSALIVVRASGFADVLPGNEPQLLGLVARLYGLPGPPSRERLAVLAEPWRPLRTWVSVLIRAAGPRLVA